MNGHDPLDRLRPQGDPPVPSAADDAYMRRRLDDLIDDEERRLAMGPVSRRKLLFALIGAGAAAGVAGWSFLARPGTGPMLLEIARVARSAHPDSVPPGAFAYFKTHRRDLRARPANDLGLLDREWVAYIQPTTRELWRSEDLRFLQIRTTPLAPTFFDPLVEEAYMAAGMDHRDAIGTSVVEQFDGISDPLLTKDWPVDPAELRRAMDVYLSSSGDDRPVAVDLLDLASQMLREVSRPPQLRAALLEVLAQLPLENLVPAGVGLFSFGLTFRQELRRRMVVSFDSEGNLVTDSVTLLEPDAQLQVPAGTAIALGRYELPQTVDTLPG